MKTLYALVTLASLKQRKQRFYSVQGVDFEKLHIKLVSTKESGNSTTLKSPILTSVNF